MIRRRLAALGIVMAAAAVACGGGGGSSPTGQAPALPVARATAAPSSTAAPAGTARTTLSITVPNAAPNAARRSPQYVSSQTRSVKFTLLKTDAALASMPAPQTFPLDASQSYCATTSAGLNCTLNIDAPLGHDIYTAETFSDAAATQKIGGGAVALTVQANATNAATISLGGPIASAGVLTGFNYVYLAAYASPQPSATPGGYSITVPSVRLYVIALDTNQNLIISPDTYSQPVMINLYNAYYANYDSAGRKLADVSVYASTTDPADEIVLTVRHRDGTTASTSHGVDSVAVTAPDDVVTASVNPTFASVNNYSTYIGLGTTIGSATPPTFLNYYNSNQLRVYPAVCPTGWTGSEPNCAPPPTPSPTPTPSCAPGTWFYPYYGACTPVAMTWYNNTGDGRLSFYTTPQVYQFTSLADTRQADLYMTINDTGFTGSVTFDVDPAGGPANAANCARLAFTSPGSTGSVTTGGMTVMRLSTYYPLGFTIASPPPNAMKCFVRASGDNATTQLEIDVNNVSGGGTIQ